MDPEDEFVVYEVKNGKVEWHYAEWEQRVNSARMVPFADIANMFDQQNVQLVQGIFPWEKFEELFPQHYASYTYFNFLKSVAQFPAFCNEHNNDANREKNPQKNNLEGQEKACRRELATFFAHSIFETGQAKAGDINSFKTGLTYRREINCQNENQEIKEASCDYHDGTSQLDPFFPANKEKDYLGRGALQMRWSSIYGRFSSALFSDKDNGEEWLKNHPDTLIEPHLMFLSALWLYMTPQFPKTSAHQLVTNFYSPTEDQLVFEVGSSFGSTIDALGHAESPQTLVSECSNTMNDTASSLLRAEIYQHLLEFFGLEPERYTSCYLMAYGYSEDTYPFWEYDKLTPFTCIVVAHPTPFSVYNPDDYKRCVCDQITANGGKDECKQINKCSWDLSSHIDGAVQE